MTASLEGLHANLTIASSLFLLPNGVINLGRKDLSTFTILEVKTEINAIHPDATLPLQNLWWNGYLLDDDRKKIIEACVGKDPKERLSPNTTDLTIFLTVPRSTEKDSDPRSTRKSSFERR